MNNKVIVTYFEPFGGRAFNASMGTALGLSNEYIKIGLPVSWNEIDARIAEILSLKPDFLFLIGEAGMIDEPRLELEAHNISKGKDNYGIEKFEEPIIKDGIDTLYTPLKKDERFVLSADAGKYLCNCSYYLALSKANGTKVIFIHVPAYNEEELEKKNHCIEVASKMIDNYIKD